MLRRKVVADDDDVEASSIDDHVVDGVDRRALRNMSVANLTEDEIAARAEMLLSGDSTEEFLVELEQKMILGVGKAHRIIWARNTYDVDTETLNAIEALIRQGHKLELLEVMSIATKRFKQVQRHMLVFQRAMEAEDYKEANKALENISKIEGLMAPDTNVNVNISATADVTSKTRERIAQLQETAYRRFKERQETIKGGRLKVIEASSEEKKEVG